MRWPWSSEKKEDGQKSTGQDDKLHSVDWGHYTEPKNILASAVLATSILATVRIYKGYLRRIPNSAYIKPTWLRKRSIFGTVTRVGDADGFHLYHTPGGRLTGWGWLPGRTVPTDKKKLRGNTISIRLAGVDAPELAHFGQEGQPYAKEALEFLTDYISGRRVRAYMHSRDQYERIIATVYVRKWGLRKNVGLELLHRGLATVYEAKSGAEFGGLKEKYQAAEEIARKRNVGMWEQPGILARIVGVKEKNYESPREYKTRHKEQGIKK